MWDSFSSPDEQTFTSEEDIYIYFAPFFNFNIDKDLTRYHKLSKVFTNTITKYRDEHFDTLLLCKTEEELTEEINKLHRLWEANKFTNMDLYGDLMRRKSNVMIQYRLNKRNEEFVNVDKQQTEMPHVFYNIDSNTYEYSCYEYFLCLEDIHKHFDKQATHITSKNKDGTEMSREELEFWKKTAIDKHDKSERCKHPSRYSGHYR